MPKFSRCQYEKSWSFVERYQTKEKSGCGFDEYRVPSIFARSENTEGMITIHDGDVTADHRSCMLQQGYEIKLLSFIVFYSIYCCGPQLIF